MRRIPEVYRAEALDDMSSSAASTDDDANCLATLGHYRSLMPMAQEARKPMFHLKAADGALGGHIQAVQDCYEDFQKLAIAIASKCACHGSSPKERDSGMPCSSTDDGLL